MSTNTRNPAPPEADTVIMRGRARRGETNGPPKYKWSGKPLPARSTISTATARKNLNVVGSRRFEDFEEQEDLGDDVPEDIEQAVSRGYLTTLLDE
jgi:hypothetical protein